ncbi:glucose-6-phosphate exchanger SLC37A4-like [Watersipora subatra]|uniref:glucose-6-phosphate exchanger SLC37A4-like n=1 Tax=Watersipora subatra TaxID=2589382 RepID=UPI00355B6A2B
MGWPAVSKMIRAWFPPTQFGLWYALVCTVPNAIATVGPNLAAGLCVNYGWRVSVQIPALIALFASPIVGYVAVDRPSDVGYEDQLSLSGGVLQGHWSDLAGSDFMALLASTLCLLSLVKTTCMEWGSTYLTNDRGVSSYFSSSYLVAMDVGGILGSIVVGACTDFMVARQYYLKTGQSPRMIVVQLCVAGSCLFLNLLIFSIDPDTERGYIVGVGFCLGFCIYGAISLLGTVTIEVAPIHITGAAHAIVGVASNVGSIVAGIPIKHIANTWSWYHVFLGLNIVSTLVFLFLIVGKEINASYLTHTTGGPAKLRKL